MKRLLATVALFATTGCAHYAIHHDSAGHCWREQINRDGSRHFVEWLPADRCTGGK